MTFRQRLTIFGVVATAAVAVGVVSLLTAMRGPAAAAATTAGSAPVVLPPPGRPFVLFRTTAPGPDYGALAYVAADGTGPVQALSSLRCRRAHMAGGRGVCLAGVRGGVSFVARLFDDRFAVTAELPLAGVPSRTQVSPDGSLAATTVFVTGHSYADTNLSTRTSIVDLAAGRWLVEDMETFAVFRDGRRIDSPDFNFWGVTFLQDSRTFYATLATKGRTYLVRGSVDRRAVDVVAPDIECPSVSPDNQAVAYKQRVAGTVAAGQWEVWLYDLATGQRRALGERQSVDDQVQWLDDARVVYARPTEGDPSSTDLWVVARDGATAPALFLGRAGSPARLVSAGT
jgi:hypothetical protein